MRTNVWTRFVKGVHEYLPKPLAPVWEKIPDDEEADDEDLYELNGVQRWIRRNCVNIADRWRMEAAAHDQPERNHSAINIDAVKLPIIPIKDVGMYWPCPCLIDNGRNIRMGQLEFDGMYSHVIKKYDIDDVWDRSIRGLFPLQPHDTKVKGAIRTVKNGKVTKKKNGRIIRYSDAHCYAPVLDYSDTIAMHCSKKCCCEEMRCHIK